RLESLPGESRKLTAMRYDGTSGGVANRAAHFGRSVQSIYAQIKRIKVALHECVGRRPAQP
ncbi:MAG: hypothetical protein ACJ8F7_13800, partial [Gemmataceae bacterium]